MPQAFVHLQDSIQGLEGAITTKQRSVEVAEDRRVLAYTQQQGIQARLARAVTALIQLARMAPPDAVAASPQRATGPTPIWPKEGLLPKSMSVVLTGPSASDSIVSATGPAVSASEDSHDTPGVVPVPLSALDIIREIPAHTVSDMLPYACMAGAVGGGSGASTTRLTAASVAAATVGRFAEQLRAQRAAAAAANGVPPAAVRWVLQSPWSVASGAAVSFASSTTSPQGLAAMHFCRMALLLEGLLVSVSLDPATELPMLPGASPTSRPASHHLITQPKFAQPPLACMRAIIVDGAVPLEAKMPCKAWCCMSTPPLQERALRT